MNLYTVRMDVNGRVFTRYMNGNSKFHAMLNACLKYGCGAMALECELVGEVK